MRPCPRQEDTFSPERICQSTPAPICQLKPLPPRQVHNPHSPSGSQRSKEKEAAGPRSCSSAATPENGLLYPINDCLGVWGFLSTQDLRLSILSLLNNWRKSGSERDILHAPAHLGENRLNRVQATPRICQAEPLFQKLSEMPPGTGRHLLHMKHCSRGRGRKPCRETNTTTCWQELHCLKTTGGMSGILNKNSRKSEALWLTGKNLKGNKYLASEKKHEEASVW